jgi:hypothetical protein
VTGRRSNQLSYAPEQGLPPVARRPASSMARDSPAVSDCERGEPGKESYMYIGLGTLLIIIILLLILL